MYLGTESRGEFIAGEGRREGNLGKAGPEKPVTTLPTLQTCTYLYVHSSPLSVSVELCMLIRNGRLPVCPYAQGHLFSQTARRRIQRRALVDFLFIFIFMFAYS